MATVTHVELPDGSHAIGVGKGDKFVPFATLDAARYKQLEDNEFYSASGGKDKDDDDNEGKKKGGAK
jgi:hypothetical protein